MSAVNDAEPEGIETPEPTREQLLKAIKNAYFAMHSEYMYCPWCTGHIGYENDIHDEYCIWNKLGPQLDPGFKIEINA